ncbi:MAG TPA: HAD family hydrolase, partial [Thermoanaerobaculia bacterium]|nr:HAD family hydrolase [Thermoanaerobaculia bacterium]
MRRRLVLFDIDGTLVTDGGAARGAFAVALGEVFGYDGDLHRYDFSGRTDPQIASMVLRDAGWRDEDIAARFDALWHTYVAELTKNATADRVRALPGIPELLEALQGDERVTLALLTGNIEPGARLKLAPPSLNDYFPFGAFGSDSANRDELPPIAGERASQIYGYRFTGRDVVI